MIWTPFGARMPSYEEHGGTTWRRPCPIMTTVKGSARLDGATRRISASASPFCRRHHHVVSQRAEKLADDAPAQSSRAARVERHRRESRRDGQCNLVVDVHREDGQAGRDATLSIIDHVVCERPANRNSPANGGRRSTRAPAREVEGRSITSDGPRSRSRGRCLRGRRRAAAQPQPKAVRTESSVRG